MNLLNNMKNIYANIILIGEKKNNLFVMSTGVTYVKKKIKQTDNATIWHVWLVI